MSDTKPNGTKPSDTITFEPKRGKVVGRNVAIALGIICILLGAGLGVVIYMGYSPTSSTSTTSLQSQINDLNSTYNSYVSTHSHTNDDFNSLSSQNANLQNQYNTYVGDHNYTNEEYQNLLNQYNAYVGDHSHTDEEYNSLSSQNTNLQNQVNDLTDTLNLGKSTIWVNNQPISEPASSYVAWNFAANYAGYLSVWVKTSSSTTTYVRVIYSSHGVNYDNQITVGTGGTAVFPILPSGSIEVRVGNTNLITGHTQTVTITYYY
jgi:hypothetical protein